MISKILPRKRGLHHRSVAVPGASRAGFGLGFAADLAPVVRANMQTELWGAIAYGLFFATALQFIPVVLRRMGASSELLALYTAQTYLGSLLTAFSIVLMRRRRTKTFAVWCWLIARSIFILFAFVKSVYWLLALMAVFWLLEAFPSPAYTRILQAIYPENVRGKVMSLVRFGKVGAILAITPLAGWMLDSVGYRVLFPIGALAGVAATFYFNRLQVDEGELPQRQPKSIVSLWRILIENRSFAIHVTAFSVYGLGAMMGYALYPIVQVDRLGLSYTSIGMLGLAQSVTWLLGFLVWGRAVDRTGGLPVLRVNLAIAAIVPAAYIWANDGWWLLPAFLAQGIVSAGIDLGLINTCIQLSDPERVVEYAAVQSTIIGLRGMLAPFIGVALIMAGATQGMVFAIATILILLSWVILGQIRTAMTPEEIREKRRLLRFRWPLRFRYPRL